MLINSWVDKCLLTDACLTFHGCEQAMHPWVQLPFLEKLLLGPQLGIILLSVL